MPPARAVLCAALEWAWLVTASKVKERPRPLAVGKWLLRVGASSPGPESHPHLTVVQRPVCEIVATTWEIHFFNLLPCFLEP